MSVTKIFQHFIITAFNVDFGLKSREKILSNSYLSQRFDIFKTICFPSVFNQINHNFKWLVFFDSETPKPFKEEIYLLEKKLTNFIPVFVKPVINPGVFWQEIIEQYIDVDINTDTKPKYIITTNLDNDDAISKDFIEIIQKQFHQQEFEFLNFPYGYMLRENGLFLREFLSSPFISLIEKSDNPLTCKNISHNDLFELHKKGVAVRQIFTKPVWLQVVHQSNVINWIDINSVFQSINKLDQNFHIQIDKSKYNKSSQLTQQLNFTYNFLFQNQHQIPLILKLRRLFIMILPDVAPYYLNLSLAIKKFLSPSPTLSTKEARSVCEAWTSEYENLKVNN
jgi:Putative rhamnosyl transferase